MSKNEKLIIKLDDTSYHKGEVVMTPEGRVMIVDRVYNKVWWRRLLLYIGIKTSRYNSIRLTEYKKNKHMSKRSEETYQIANFIRLLTVLPDRLKVASVRVEGLWTNEDIQQLTQAGYVVDITGYDFEAGNKYMHLILPKDF